ncbi:sensor histidine kinase [Thermaurantiacus tibetensis]|uniref:sensor histidine kinase n=1 Tax=Thermaurantiacus tibetensis TaxID=2759035 RepID=UPI00188EE9CC|nr:HAMP domain-containing sensor histidine kinase [Thermaurantiacus tibetensis]
MRLPALLRSLWRATPLRLALGLVLLFAVTGTGLLGLAFAQMRSSLEAQIEAALEARLAPFLAPDEAEDVSEAVAAEARASDPERRAIVFVAADGASLGNVRLRPGKDEAGAVRFARAPGFGKPSRHGYATREVPVAGGRLLLGESLEPIHELEEVFGRLLLFGLAPALLASLAAGLWLGLASARRVARIEAALARLGAGDLAARVGEPPRADDLGAIAAAVDRMASALDETMAALRQVSADIAHDLKTPVQRIALHLAELGRRLPADGPEAELVARAEAESARAVGIFEALLHIARIEAGSARARFARFDLAGLAATIVDLHAPAAEESGHALDLLRPPGEVPLLGDRDLVGQALSNLIDNALRHTPPGTSVRVEVTRGEEGVQLTVADTGPGIPQAERGAVLRRFHRLERSRTTPGHGLGLALVAAVAAAHDARLTLTDATPGLRVDLLFPGAA